MTAIIVWAVFAVASAGMGLLRSAIIGRTRPIIAAALASAVTISIALLVVDRIKHSLSGWSAVALIVVFPLSFAIAWKTAKWWRSRSGAGITSHGKV
jgi:hypothetical protein